MSVSYCAVTAGGAKVSARTHDLQVPVIQGVVALRKGYSVWVKRYNPRGSVRLLLDGDGHIGVVVVEPDEQTFAENVRATLKANIHQEP